MQVSATASLEIERAQYTIGRVSARSPWRPADRELDQADRETALRALMREAEEYGADGVVEIEYEVEGCAGPECQGVKLRRYLVTGTAVRLAMAA